MIKNTFLILFLWFICVPAHTTLIIFSYNRPLQLYALVESIQEHITGLDYCAVIYRAGSPDFEAAYTQVQNRFINVSFEKQHNPPNDFKSLTIKLARKYASDYLMFAVDDIIVKDKVNVSHAIALMEEHQAYGFYLRLGTHLTYAYANYEQQALPPFVIDAHGICVWNFTDGQWDWGYPHSLDMTIYRAQDILPWLESLDYQNPNQLEHYLAISAPHGPRGICYDNSKIINLPINVVQTYTHNNCVNSYSTEQLLEYFNAGLALDTRHLYQVNNSACHMFDAQILFIPRI